MPSALAHCGLGTRELNEREAHEHWSFLTIQSEDLFSTHQLTKLNNDPFEGSSLKAGGGRVVMKKEEIVQGS